MFEVKITVGLKKGVSDPEGANTLKTLHLLGFSNVVEVKTTKTYDLIIGGENKEDVKKNVEKMCQRLLTNPVIHTFKIKIFEK